MEPQLLLAYAFIIAGAICLAAAVYFSLTDMLKGPSKPCEHGDEILRYWHKARPIPDGWEVADDMADCHHGEYAIILRQTKR